MKRFLARFLIAAFVLTLPFEERVLQGKSEANSFCENFALAVLSTFSTESVGTEMNSVRAYVFGFTLSNRALLGAVGT